MVPTAPVFLTHVPSLVFVGIDWSSHHHLMYAVHRVNDSIMWANLDRPFWLSLAPVGDCRDGRESRGAGSRRGIGNRAAVRHDRVVRAGCRRTMRIRGWRSALGSDFSEKGVGIVGHPGSASRDNELLAELA
jgi:hypothetical protein